MANRKLPKPVHQQKLSRSAPIQPKAIRQRRRRRSRPLKSIQISGCTSLGIAPGAGHGTREIRKRESPWAVARACWRLSSFPHPFLLWHARNNLIGRGHRRPRPLADLAFHITPVGFTEQLSDSFTNSVKLGGPRGHLGCR